MIVAIAYLYVFPYQPRINNPNENVRLYMTAAMVEEGRYEIDSQRSHWGWVNDAAMHEGHFYSVKAPGASILAIPGYALYRWLCNLVSHEFDRTEALWCCRMTGSILPTLLWLWFVIAFLRQRTDEHALADASFFALALGSPIYGYTMMLASHTTSAVAAFGAFMLLVNARRSGAISAPQAFGAGALAAAATWLEYQCLVASVALTVFAVSVLWHRGGMRKLGCYALGALLPTLSTMHFQYHAFGNALTPGHLVLETTAFRTIHSQGFYGLVGPKPEALRTLLVDFGDGLFPLTPLLALGVIGIAMQLTKRALRAEAICSLAIIVLTFLAVASATYWRGGWTIGPRYLMVTVPFLVLGALEPLNWLTRRRAFAARALAVGLVAVGMIAAGVPSAYYPHIPPEITRPLPQLFAPLIAAGYAPYNACALLGLHGTLSMLPLAFTAAGALLYCSRGLNLPGVVRAVPLAIAVAALGLAPILWGPRNEPGVAQAVAFVMGHWSP